MHREEYRLAFLVERDGVEESVAFAARTYAIYVAALKTDYGRAFRRELILSCLDFRVYLKRYGRRA